METKMNSSEKNILVVSSDPKFTQNIRNVLADEDDTKVNEEATTFAAMNGKGAGLAFQNDLVIFYADPEDAGEVSAIAELLADRKEHTAFMAITDG